MGDRLVQLVYLDEAGVANPRDDPHIVVLGVMVNADKKWLRVQRRLVQLADLHAKPAHRDGFFFHVKELRYGSKRLPRGSYTSEEANAMIRDMCAVPVVFEMPLVAAYVDRAALRSRYPKMSSGHMEQRGLVVASSTCIMMVEKYMRHIGGKDEGAQLTFENNEKSKRLVRDIHKHFRKPETQATALSQGNKAAVELLPLERVPDTPTYAEKTDASILQVADACVYATKRHLAGQDKEGFFELIKDRFTLGPLLVSA